MKREVIAALYREVKKVSLRRYNMGINLEDDRVRHVNI